MYCHNKPTIITEKRLKKGKLKMTASEMICFVRLFGLMIGAFVPAGDPYWELYNILRDILDIVLAKTLSKNTDPYINQIVQDHNATYLQLTKGTLKPKMHHIIHYGRIFHMSGPFAHYSCMRFEAKHKDLKKWASANNCRINLAHFLAVKHQMAFSCRLMLKEGFSSTTVKGTEPTDFETTNDFHQFC